jgi:GNAT superfamily N-acetyltransferase
MKRQMVIRQSDAVVAYHRPDEHWVAGADGAVGARLSLWWREAPVLPTQRLGVIGHYAASDDRAAAALLEHATRRLAAHDCTLAVGPMDGNTWRSYRFLTEKGTEPPFFLEPSHPDSWPAQWRAAGFDTLASYFSALNANLDHLDPTVENRGVRLRDSGIQLRPLRLEHLRDELLLLHDLSTKSFTANFLYSPLGPEEFLEQGLAMRERLRPELILIAEQIQEPVGFIFALPDWLQPPQALDTAVIKTVAVVPCARQSGLGAWLVAQAQHAARSLGFTRVIHALMHESNASMKVSARYASVFRRYVLFGKSLGPSTKG